MRTPWIPVVGLSMAALLWRCGGLTSNDPPDDAGPRADTSPVVDAPTDASTDSATGDASTTDASTTDASTTDASTTDAGDAGDASAADASGDASTADAGACSPGCGVGRTCCDGKCINPDNDPLNCGGCNVRCGGATPFCDGTCKPLACNLPGGCTNGGLCCGASCCGAGAICCKNEGPVATLPMCFTPTASQPTCPQGCAPQCVSDRDLKRDITPADERAVLDAVGRLPVSTWSYTTDRAAVRHIGPMAQDFHAAFGGATPLAYDPIDAHGVELASIKALYDMVREQDARIERLERENRALRGQARAPLSCSDTRGAR